MAQPFNILTSPLTLCNMYFMFCAIFTMYSPYLNDAIYHGLGQSKWSNNFVWHFTHVTPSKLIFIPPVNESILHAHDYVIFVHTFQSRLFFEKDRGNMGWTRNKKSNNGFLSVLFICLVARHIKSSSDTKRTWKFFSSLRRHKVCWCLDQTFFSN